MRRLVFLLAVLAAPASAQQFGQRVQVIVPVARLFQVDPDPVLLELTTPTATGFAPVTAPSSYDINIQNKQVRGTTATYRITVHSTEAYPDGVSLSVEVAAASNQPDGGTSTGQQAVPTGVADAVTVVSGLRKVNGRGRPITYTAEAELTAVAGVHARTVVYTLSQE